MRSAGTSLRRFRRAAVDTAACTHNDGDRPLSGGDMPPRHGGRGVRQLELQLVFETPTTPADEPSPATTVSKPVCRSVRYAAERRRTTEERARVRADFAEARRHGLAARHATKLTRLRNARLILELDAEAEAARAERQRPVPAAPDRERIDGQAVDALPAPPTPTPTLATSATPPASQAVSPSEVPAALSPALPGAVPGGAVLPAVPTAGLPDAVPAPLPVAVPAVVPDNPRSAGHEQRHFSSGLLQGFRSRPRRRRRSNLGWCGRVGRCRWIRGP